MVFCISLYNVLSMVRIARINPPNLIPCFTTSMNFAVLWKMILGWKFWIFFSPTLLPTFSNSFKTIWTPLLCTFEIKLVKFVFLSEL